MNTELKLDRVEQGKYPKAYFNGQKASFSFENGALAAGLVVGQTYSIDYIEKPVSFNGKSWNQKSIAQIAPVQQPLQTLVQAPVQTNGNGHHQNGKNDKAIATMNCINNAVAMVQAESSVMATTGKWSMLSETQIQNFLQARFVAHFEYFKKLNGVV